MDFRFFAPSSAEALQWVSGFADLQCFVNCLPHPLESSKKQSSDIVASDFLPEYQIKCKSPPKILVILNPRSGRGRSSKVFHSKVEPIFKVCCCLVMMDASIFVIKLQLISHSNILQLIPIHTLVFVISCLLLNIHELSHMLGNSSRGQCFFQVKTLAT